MWEILYRKVDRSKEPRSAWSQYANVYLYSVDSARAIARLIRDDWNSYESGRWQVAIRQVSDTQIEHIP